jgi:hypothetical protein
MADTEHPDVEIKQKLADLHEKLNRKKPRVNFDLDVVSDIEEVDEEKECDVESDEKEWEPETESDEEEKVAPKKKTVKKASAKPRTVDPCVSCGGEKENNRTKWCDPCRVVKNDSKKTVKLCAQKLCKAPKDRKGKYCQKCFDESKAQSKINRAQARAKKRAQKLEKEMADCKAEIADEPKEKKSKKTKTTLAKEDAGKISNMSLHK